MLSCKGNEFKHEELKNHALTIMEELGYADNPILIYGHNDTVNNHVHIVTSRVGPDGKKIAHDLEGVRANKIVRDILRQNPTIDFEFNLTKAMSYNFTTDSQLYLLMERMGYDFKEMPDRILFFKHGEKQGKILKTDLLKKITQNKSLHKNPAQIKALIHKYSSSYSTKIRLIEHPTYTSAKPQFESDLTNFLKEKLDFEFVFFASKKGGENPFGYVVIDHCNKTVFKGSEVIRLNELMELGNRGMKQKVDDMPEKRVFTSRATDQSVAINQDANAEKESVIDLIISGVVEISGLFTDENSAINSSAGEEAKRRKKRKNNFF